jgi:hypothetical protein
MNGWFEGVVQHGHGVASGVNSESPYTKGTIAIQSPLFKKAWIGFVCLLEWNN